MVKYIRSVLLTIFVLTALSCGRQDSDTALNGLPEESLEVSVPADFTGLISSYSAGILSRDSGIRINLAEPLPEGTGEEQLRQLFTFEPEIKGTVTTPDSTSLVFQPSSPLPSGQFYSVSFALGKIRDVQEDKSLFQFSFSTIRQDMEISVDRTDFAVPGDAGTVSLHGRLRTADSTETEEVEKVLQPEGSFESVEWDHQGPGNIHSFVIRGIPRQEESSVFVLNWTGESLGVDRTGSESVEIPPLNVFRFLSWRQTKEPQKAVELSFSMPLKEDQETAGLIRIGGEDVNEVSIRGSHLIIYTDRITTRDRKLNLDGSLKDSGGSSLGRPVEFTIPRSQEKPMARFLTDGGLLPGSDRFVLPLEAVSLKALDVEIIRVFENNMVQYLQDNQDVRGGYQLNRVGLPVAFRTVSLEGRGVDNLNVTNRFELDMTPWVKPEPGALYQVRLSFRRSQSLYPCEHNHSEEDDLPLNQSIWNGPSYGTAWDQYYYSDWRNRDNPCSNTYYARRTDEVSFIASDLGVIAKKSDVSGMTVYVTDLLTAEPAGGAEVTLFSFQQQEIGRGTTDGNGYVFIKPSGVPFALRASREGMNSWLRVDNGTSLSLSDFEIEGQAVRDGLKGFIYGERGVWRPGDALHLSFILQDELKTLPQGHPVVFELLDPDGRSVQRLVSTEPAGRIYGFTAGTAEDAPTGLWTARVTVGGAVFTKSIRIETVKPNRLKINLTAPEQPLRSGRIPLPMEVRWLHGAVARNLKAEMDMTLSARPTSFDGYGSYTFDDPSRSFYSPPETIFSGQIDERGRSEVILPLSSQRKSSGFLNVDLQTKVFEEGGDFSLARNTYFYSPYESYVGIRPPAGDRKRGMLLTDEDHILDIVCLDREGLFAERENLEVEMYKLDWKWWWDRSDEDLARFVSRNYRHALKRENVPVTNGKASWTFRVNYPEWGRYLIRVTDPVSGHSAGQILFIDWPGWAGAPQRGDSASRLSFYADKEEYRTGETAVLTVPTDPGGRILISLEDGTGILNSWWVASQEESTRIEFMVEPEMAPTVYVHASYVQPYSQSANDLPIRMYGIIPLNVTDPRTRLEPVLQMPAVLEPEQEVTIRISEKQGRPMAYTLAVVDDGLLDLTNFRTPDPWSSFFSRETLGVRTWDIFDDIVNARTADFGTLLSLGGGEGGAPKPPKKASRFKPVVRYFGPFELKEGESVSHSFTMPLYVGSVRVMAVAAAESAYGHTEKTVPVRTDLMVLGTLPRVLGPEERIQLPVNVFSLSPDGGTVRVSVSAGGPLELTGETVKEITFTEPADDYVYFEAVSSRETGPVRVRFTAEMDGKTATQEIDFNVRPSNPPTTRLTSLTVQPGEKVRLALEPFGLTGQFSQVLETSVLPPLNLDRRLDYLIRYPHGCVEQTVSAVFPQIYLPSLTDLPESRQEEMEKNIREGINRLKRFQLKDGGFAYWISLDHPSPWGTSYAGHFLLEARKAGYHVPGEMVDDFVRYQKDAVNKWRPGGEESSLNQAYRLYTLALAGHADMAGMNRLRESRALTRAAWWKLAAAYQLAGRDDAARDLMKDLSTDIRESQEDDSYGSILRDQALVLETLALTGRKKEADRIFREVAAQLSSEEWMSTQTTAYALISTAAWLGEGSRDETPSFSWRLEGGKEETVIGTSKYHTLNLPPGKGILEVWNPGEATLYLNLVSRGIPLRGEDRDEAGNLTMNISYKPKNPDPGFRSDSITSGTDFIMEVRITNPPGQPERKNLALEQILPAGWEIINPRLFATDEEQLTERFDHQDIRDDRIYTYFDLARGGTKRFYFLLNASYRGQYYQPSVRCSAMYDETVYAVRAGRTVEVR